MSTNFRSMAITKMLDKIFDDKCLYGNLVQFNVVLV